MSYHYDDMFCTICHRVGLPIMQADEDASRRARAAWVTFWAIAGIVVALVVLILVMGAMPGIMSSGSRSGVDQFANGCAGGCLGGCGGCFGLVLFIALVIAGAVFLAIAIGRSAAAKEKPHCIMCGSPDVVPVDSPKAQAFLNKD